MPFTHAVAVLIMVVAVSMPGFGESAGLVGSWGFDEGTGEITRNSADANDAAVHGAEWVSVGDGAVKGAEWVTTGAGSALVFTKPRAHVTMGNPPELDLTGPLSLETWVYPLPDPPSETGIAGKSFRSFAFTIYGDQKFYWYVGSGANKCSAPARFNSWNHLVGTFDGKTLCLYVDGKLRDSRASRLPGPQQSCDFLVGCIVNSEESDSHTDSFKGAVDGVRVYNRALAPEEVRMRYDAGKGTRQSIEEGSDRIAVAAFPYADKGVVLADVDFGGLFPLAAEDRVSLALFREGDNTSLATVHVPAPDEDPVVRNVRLDAHAFAPGTYALVATLEGEAGRRFEAKTRFAYGPPAALPSPEHAQAPALPVKRIRVPFDVDLHADGGFSIEAEGQRFAVESSYSFPHGGENLLGDAPSSTGEPGWTVALEEPRGTCRIVAAEGAYYRIRRELVPLPGRILVNDTITNLLDEPIGIIIQNRLIPRRESAQFDDLLPNPTVFCSSNGLGVGMVALDDVFLEQHENFAERNAGGLRTRRFALDTGASYTLEWAVYVHGTGDYYDFLNAVRRDEGLNRTIEGGFAFVDRFETPSEEYVAVRGLKYASIGCLSNVAGGDGLDIEGIEFLEYPEECARLRKTFAETKRRFPDMKVMFHIAHSLYTTNKPDDLFPGSRVVDASGAQTDYGAGDTEYYARYFTQEQVDAGYRWFIFYPTRDNTFGAAMLDATGVMLDEIGATGMFGDGLTHGYGGRWTYNRWDGHSAEINPETKTISRFMGSVNLLSQDLLIEVVRRINARGGAVIANSHMGTRTFHREDVIYCIETHSGGKTAARLYLTPTVVGLGNPSRISCERDVYLDALRQLQWGGLYFFYAEGTLTHPTLPTHMYPITVTEIGKGIVKGRERIITMNSGVYGWPNDPALHHVRTFDGRGIQVPHAFITTADAGAVRTQIALAKNESAVIERIPVTLAFEGPINLRVEAYGPEQLALTLNGTGPATLTLAGGPLPVRAGCRFAVNVNETEQEIEAEGPSVAIFVGLDGEVRIAVSRRTPKRTRPHSPTPFASPPDNDGRAQ